MLDISAQTETGALPGLEALAQECLAATLEKLGAKAETEPEISLLLASDETVRQLNKQYRNRDLPTNVLSFAYENDGNGDIAVSMETLAREAAEKDIPLENHFAHLLVHGFLHLYGYDHIDDNDADEMEALEVEILEKLKIENPYE